MVLIAPLIGAAVFLSGFAAALPTSDYSSGSSNSYGGSSGSSNSYGGSSGSSNSYGGSSDSSNSYGGSSGSSNSYGGSSDSNSNYGSSDSSNSNYGSNSDCGSSGCDNSKDTTSSSMMMDTTSTKMMEETSSTMMMEESSSTMMMEESSSTMMMETSTTSAMTSSETSNYGSGSTNWGGSGYQDCVNQCIAQFGSGGDSSSGGGGGSYQATATSGSEGSKGTGSTHTVIVAPTKGVFRMMPFATNASVGDTIEFHWGADGHTVTKSSELTPCNKSAADPVFASGTQNQSFVFTQVVNDTNPTFYFCGTPGHCDKGMFGIINPKMATPGAPTSLGGMMTSMAANDSNLAAYAAYTKNVTASNDAAARWGSNFDMSSLPEWSHSLLATNVMYTRAALAMNSEILQPDNSVDLSSVATTPLMLPMDLTSALNAASAPPSTDAGAAGAAGAAATAPAGAAESSPAADPKTGAASSVASPRLLVGAVMVLATIFAL